MKKIAVLLMIALLFVSGLYSCGPKTETPTPAETNEVEGQKEEQGETQEEQGEIKEDTQSNDEISVKLEELEIVKEIESEPRPDGTTWSRFFVKNNSNYPIRSMMINYEPIDGVEVDNQGFFNTVMPGGDSTYMYQEVTKGEPIISSVQYVVYVDGKYYEITFNAKEEKYEQIVDEYQSMLNLPKEEVKLPADKIAYKYVTDPPDQLGMVYSTFEFQNNSEYPLTAIYLTVFSPQDRSSYIVGASDISIAPGGNLPDITSFGAEELLPVEILYIFEIDGKEYNYTYNYQLDAYSGTR